MENIMTFYAIRNEKGDFFRAKGFSNYGKTWVNDIKNAKIYSKPKGARGVITWFANRYPEFPTLELIQLNVTSFDVINELVRVQEAKSKKMIAEAKRKEVQLKWDLERAEKSFKEAQDKLEKLKNKQN